MLPVAAEYHVGMSLYQARRHQPAFGVDDGIGVLASARQPAAVRNLPDNAVLDQNSGFTQLQVFALLLSAVAEAAYGSLQQADILY